MARIRTIKPEFPQSESMGRMSRDARLLFILMWTIADDAGRLRGNPRVLCGQLFPYDDDAPQNIESWVDELIAEECIIRYTSGGAQYIQIVAWRQHQKIDKPSDSRLPDPPSSPDLSKTPQQVSNSTNPRECSRESREASRETREHSRTFATDSRSLATDLGPRTLDLGPNTEPKSSADDVTKKRFQKPTPDQVAEYATSKNLQVDAGAFWDFYESKGWKVGSEPMKDWPAAVRNWARNSGSRASPKATPEEDAYRRLQEQRDRDVKVYR